MQNFVTFDSDLSQNNEIDFDKDIDEILKEIENDPDVQIDEQEIENILKEIDEETQNTPKPQINAGLEGLK
jgi:CBS-domain-containing membrane protein